MSAGSLCNLWKRAVDLRLHIGPIIGPRRAEVVLQLHPFIIHTIKTRVSFRHLLRHRNSALASVISTLISVCLRVNTVLVSVKTTLLSVKKTLRLPYRVLEIKLLNALIKLQ
jgi:hypothetical protein